ncbi:MAG: hypothetical protein C0469_18240 [Cyanobacteria bacterium DS2.3.42]|nr:hypothetical protein [Cyanobacteria bacterium DS2.3.42]
MLTNSGKFPISGYVKVCRTKYPAAYRLSEMSHEPSHDEEKVRGVGELLKEAATSLKLHRYVDAEDFCVQALGVLDKASAVEHPSKAMALEFMGDALTGLERYEEAGRFYKRAMDLSERIFTQENQVYISIVYKLARTYESLSLLDECEPYFKLADELAKRHLSSDHPLRDSIAEGYAHLISRTKKRREKVVEIMGTFRTAKDRNAGDRVAQEGDENEDLGITEQTDIHQSQDRQDRQERNTPPAYKDLREKSTLYNNSSESMQLWVTIAMLGVVVWLFYLGFQQFSKRVAPKPSAVVQDEKVALTDFVKTYSSLDGKRKLKIANGNRGVVEFGPTRADVQVFQGDDAWKSGTASAAKDALKLNFVESQLGITDDVGNVLYADDSPEIGIRTAMQSIAKALRNSYLMRGSFPQNADELNQFQISYKNPVTGKVEAPIIQVYRAEQGWNPSNPEEKSTFETSFEAGNLWTNEPPFLPGSVHIFILAGAPNDEPGTTANRSAVAIIKGADRNGTSVKLDKDKAFLIVLTPKSERSTISSTQYPVGLDGSKGAVVTIQTGK